jgi:valyl-tRNA synthetase
MANTTIFVNDVEFARPDWQSGTIQVTATSPGTVPLSTGFFVSEPVRSPVREGVVSVAMPTSFDANAERARLAKEMAKCDADIARVDQKLGNADFLKRAPEDVVEGEREKREDAQARRAKLTEALERLKGTA